MGSCQRSPSQLRAKGRFNIHFPFIHPSGCINTPRSFMKKEAPVHLAALPLVSVPFPSLGRKVSHWQLILSALDHLPGTLPFPSLDRMVRKAEPLCHLIEAGFHRTSISSSTYTKYLCTNTFLSELPEVGEALIWDANAALSLLKQKKQSCSSTAKQCACKS